MSDSSRATRRLAARTLPASPRLAPLVRLARLKEAASQAKDRDIATLKKQCEGLTREYHKPRRQGLLLARVRRTRRKTCKVSARLSDSGDLLGLSALLSEPPPRPRILIPQFVQPTRPCRALHLALTDGFVAFRRQPTSHQLTHILIENCSLLSFPRNSYDLLPIR